MRTILRQFTFLLCLFTASLSTAAQTPTIEYSSLLRGFGMGHETRRLGFARVWDAFFPEEAIDRGQNGGPRTRLSS